MTDVRSRCAALLLAAAVFLGIGAAARAADEATPDTALNEAKEDFETAQTFFVRGEYDAAAAKFLEAYNKKPYPAFLFNVAVSYEKGKQLEKAKTYFEKYLQDDPNASDAAQVRLRLDVIGKLVAPPPPAPPVAAPPAPVSAVEEPTEDEKPDEPPPIVVATVEEKVKAPEPARPEAPPARSDPVSIPRRDPEVTIVDHGETLDDVAIRVYGTRAGVETLLRSNREVLTRRKGPLRAGLQLWTPAR
jgi:tetratricopeptide (TPR) repeat protein